MVDPTKHILPKEFYYQKDNNTVSKTLLGKYFIKLSPTLIGGIIVETESYPGGDDVVSHHHHQKITERTKIIFDDKKGLLYVYMIYGLHHCFGVTSGCDGQHNVSLIRAIQPVFGLEELKGQRKINNLENLLNGPSKIAQAFDITKENYGQCVWSADSEIMICDLKDFLDFEIVSSPRIGLSGYAEEYAQRPWRFFIKDSKYLSM